MASSPPEISSTLLGQNSSASRDASRDNTTPNETINHTSTTNSNATNAEEEDSHFQKKKRQKTSAVWLEFKEVELPDGSKKAECIHCKTRLSILQSRSTSHFSRHLQTCVRRMLFQKQQQRITLQVVDHESSPQVAAPALTDGKLDMMKMRESMAHWILMHEHPFTIVEEEGFNLMQNRGMLDWQRVSRNTIKKDCVHVYEAEKKKLKDLLKTVMKISVTTDLWKSTAQKIEYMVLTGHFIDSKWRLHKRVLSFVHLPPPHRGVEIADNLYKCMKEWGIEHKVYSITLDNASNNDSAIRNLHDTFSRLNKLPCGGKLFHVRCCAHISNLMVQDGLSRINAIIEDVHNSVTFINQNEARLKMFSEIVQQLQLPSRKLILECKTRWNSTYAMLSAAIKFKEVFPRFKEREPRYYCCPSNEDWAKVENVCSILEVFNSATNIISGSEYPTSNLFLNEVYRVKVLLDKKFHDEFEDDFIHDMVGCMKENFDKYWGECSLIMSIGAILDPRCKMRVVEFCFPKIYPEEEANVNIDKVKRALKELYDEYVAEFYFNGGEQSGETTIGSSRDMRNVQASSSGRMEFCSFVKTIETTQPQKSELDTYLEEGCYICDGDRNPFDALEWWRVNSLKYRILSRMARDVLAVPITSVASEATFSAGSRVIDPYRASLSPETVQVLICGADWCRSLHGLKRKNKDEKKPTEITLPIS